MQLADIPAAAALLVVFGAVVGLGCGRTVGGRVAATAEPTTATNSQQETDTMPVVAEPKQSNRLIHATSPYLLQHAQNPVDWYEWGAEALEKAKRENKPIFLSIGYAACHWCHVMEHESFERQEVADALNEGFVSIKVDREERPDLDELYMTYTQVTTGHGGWPMSVWLTPEGAPFFAGTYFTKEQLLGLLGRIRQLWKDDREQVIARSDKAREFFDEWSKGPNPTEGVPAQADLDRVAGALANHFDRARGGLRSDNNKFPPSMAMELLLRVHRRTGEKDLLEAVTLTLDHMARGGIYDHVGGGICRYSTDPDWLVPHFEKMLYDQAMVSSVSLDAYQATRNPAFAEVARDILAYVRADLQSPEGGFYSSRDADSDGLEGAFYVWTVEQIRSAIPGPDAELFCKYYDVTDSGNWFEDRGHAPSGPKNILHVSKPPELFARMNGLEVIELNRKLRAWREKLRTVRSTRTPPGLDDKVLTSWNGLMIASLAKAARVLNEPDYAIAAGRAADFILTRMRTPDGRLLATYRSGTARLTAYLDDYAFLIEGLLNLYEGTFDPRWLDEAARLCDLAIKYYYDDKGGGFFFTASDAETLLARSKSPNDSAIPSGNSVQALNLLRLAILLDRKYYREKAEAVFRAFGRNMLDSPGSSERLACAMDFYHDRVREIAIIGDLASPRTQALLRTVYDRYLPNKVVVHAPKRLEETVIPLLRNRGCKDDLPTAYVCERYGCQLPVTNSEDLAKQLDERR